MLCAICNLVTIIALIFIATKPSFADMQSIDGFAIDRTEVTVGELSLIHN